MFRSIFNFSELLDISKEYKKVDGLLNTLIFFNKIIVGFYIISNFVGFVL